jgi:quinol-cytochrome oxidoreductase complex cytochrome b subunit
MLTSLFCPEEEEGNNNNKKKRNREKFAPGLPRPAMCIFRIIFLIFIYFTNFLKQYADLFFKENYTVALNPGSDNSS